MDKNFLKTLFSWYAENKRNMPWRRTKDPYKIWISEIILQQTRVEQGWSYYERFIERFPDIRSLAEAEEEEVLKVWQGLGYYTRARNLHATAKMIRDNYNSEFPFAYHDIRELKGIGDYTAAAISSIVFNEPYPVVDGNVLRFFSRYFGIDTPVDTAKGKKEILGMAIQHIDHRQPGEFNQAIMEFGALQCVPDPDCGACPFRTKCCARRDGKVSLLPVKGKKTLVRNRYFNYLVFVPDAGERDFLWLRKREEKDIWQNFYDFPLIETTEAVTYAQLKKLQEWKTVTGGMKPVLEFQSEIYRHVLSHQVIFATFYVLGIPAQAKLPYVRITSDGLKKIPFPRLIDHFLRFFLPLQSKFKVKL